MRRILIAGVTSLVMLTAITTVYAQNKKAAPAKPVVAAKGDTPPAPRTDTPKSAEAAPVLTDLESTKLENFKLKYQQYQLIIEQNKSSIDNAEAAKTKVQDEYAGYANALAKKYPGWAIDSTGKLAKIPEPPKK